MSSVNMIIMRGLPGCGKTTLANMINGVVCSADDFMVDENGEYKFEVERLGECHQKCFERAKIVIENGGTAIVCNTNKALWEFARYIEFCEDNNLRYSVIDLYDNGMSDKQLFENCEHGVRLDRYPAMREQYQRYWKRDQ